VIIGYKPPSRQRRMRSSLGRRIARTREYYYSLFTILVVKIVLFLFLWVLFASSIRIMRTSFQAVSPFWRFMLPGAIVAINLYIAYHIFKNIKEIREYDKDLKR